MRPLVVAYNWPTSMYDDAYMFKRDKDDTMLTNDTNPKVMKVATM